MFPFDDVIMIVWHRGVWQQQKSIKVHHNDATAAQITGNPIVQQFVQANKETAKFHFTKQAWTDDELINEWR